MKRLISKLLVVLLIIISVMVPVCAEDNDYYDENSNFVVEPSLVDLWCDYYNDLYSFNYDGESVYVIGASLYDYEIEEGQYDVDYRDFDVTIGLYEEASTENEDEYFHGNPAFEYRITDYTDFCYIAVGSESLKKGKKYRFVADYGSYEDLSLHYYICKFDGYSTDFNLNTDKITLDMEDYEIVEVANVVPRNSFPLITWTSSDESIAKIDYADDAAAQISGVKNGTCTLTATLDNGVTKSAQVDVKVPKPYLEYEYNSTYVGASFTNVLKYSSGKVSWSSSNKKIASVTSSGKITAKAIGKCYIYAKNNGKTYKCEVVVSRLRPDFAAETIDYNTRNNYFKIRLKNYGKKTLTVYSKDAKAFDEDYKAYDRNLKLMNGKSSIKVKPGKTAVINFKVKGSNTWFEYEDFWIRYYVGYDGKKYKARATFDATESKYYSSAKKKYIYSYTINEDDLIDDFYG